MRDIIVLVASIVLALWLSRSGALETVLEQTAHIRYLDAFVAGAFFTSIFTVIPAVAGIAGLARSGEPFWEIILCGALGAMVADQVVLSIIRDTITEHILFAVRHSRRARLKYFVRRSRTRLSAAILGSLFIASPLPNEIGLFLLGMSHASRAMTLPLTYVLNAVGIATIVLTARAL